MVVFKVYQQYRCKSVPYQLDVQQKSYKGQRTQQQLKNVLDRKKILASAVQVKEKQTVTRQPIQQDESGSENFFFKVDIKSLAEQKGEPRFFCYIPKDRNVLPYLEDLPTLIYVPGMDGTGGAAFRQFQTLERYFQIYSMTTPSADRTPFEGQVQTLQDFLEVISQTNSQKKPVYLLAESLGTLIALAVASRRSDLIDRMVLVNPALNIKDTIWPTLVPYLLKLDDNIYKSILPYIFVPIICNPLKVVQRITQGGEIPSDLLQARDLLFNMLKDVELIPDLVQKENLEWKLSVIQEGNEFLKDRFQEIKVRTLAIVSDNDNMVKGPENAEFLRKKLISCKIQIMPGHGHILMNEAGVDIAQLLMDNQFYITQRNLSYAPSKYHGSGIHYGTSRPVEVPHPSEYQTVYDKNIRNLRELVSPVFFSADVSGRVGKGIRAGIAGMGDYWNRPIVFVGNHQLTAQDMYIVVNEISQQLNCFLRPLGHPILFQEDNVSMSEFFKTLRLFGCVKLNAINYSSLLKQKEKMLLYPGGVPEVFQYRNSRYQVCWPDKPEFIQLAALHNAIVVPFSAVGAEDSVQVVQRASTIHETPVLGPLFERYIESNNLRNFKPPKLEGLDPKDERNTFDAPIFLPTGKIERFYFMFGKPQDLTDLNPRDESKTNQIYQQLRNDVQNGIRALRLAKESDPYRNFESRYLLERLSNFENQAPTFNLELLQQAYNRFVK